MVSNVYALVVGLGSYQDPRITPLQYARADAESFCALLLDPSCMGLSRENVRVLLDEQATSKAVKYAISDWLHRGADEGSTVLLFFAGHGCHEADRRGKQGRCEYLLTWDSDRENLFATALSSDDFNNYLDTIQARRLVVFMDACHSGGVAKLGARDVAVAALDPDSWMRMEGRQGGRAILAAAQADQQSWEDAGLEHGVFTYHLLEALRGAADSNGDGRVLISEVYSYLHTVVPQSVRRLKGELQVPFLNARLAEDIVLTVDPRRAAEVDAAAQEKTRQQREVLSEHRKVLRRLWMTQGLPYQHYERAEALLGKRGAQLSHDEEPLAALLGEILSGGISVEQYVHLASSITSREEAPKQRREGGRSAMGSRNSAPSQVVPQRFCTYCRTRFEASCRVCPGCKRKLVV